jgi:tartrate-resistant acid phosphatase type 5
VLGDFGVGIVDGRLDGARQLLIARELEKAADVRLVISTGDNIYLGHQDTAGTGNEDDEWYSSFYQPYRYVINRVPFFPTVGNHDAGDSERSDDRAQLADNFFLEHRFKPEVASGSASLDPGLFYRFQVGATLEFICIDTSLAGDMDVEHYFDDPAHLRWIRVTLEGPGARWRIPFSHHPPFCAGPEHGNTSGMVERLVPMFDEAGVRLVLSGHEHNFQYSVVNGVHYVVSGAAGKLRSEPPTGFEEARTRAWSAAGHFLLCHADEERIVVEPRAEGRSSSSIRPVARSRRGSRSVRPMLLRADGDDAIVIGQPAHAWLSGQLARAWGNERFPAPEPWEEVCLAAEQHDLGMAEWERAPKLNPQTGLPRSFMELELDDHLEIWWRAAPGNLTILSSIEGQ